MKAPHDLEYYVEFISDYYHDALGELFEKYPDDKQDFWIDYDDLWRFDADLAEDATNDPETVMAWLRDGIQAYDVPVDIDVSDLTVRLHNLPEDKLLPITALRAEHTSGFYGVSGIIEQATKAKEVPKVIAYDCQKCPGVTKVPQPDPNDIQEPYQCTNCENNGPFVINHDQSEFVDEIKLNLKQPADEAPNGQGENIMVVVRGDLIEIDGKHIQTYTGERVTVNADIERRQESRNSKEFVRYLNAHSIDFHDQQDEIDVSAHKDRFKEEAARDDCIDRFAASLVPELYETEAWEAGLKVAVAYLFGAPRIDLRHNDGVAASAVYRGDIHAAFIGDPGTMKSGVARAIAEFSPQSEHRSATGLSSEVGLTASAVESSDFNDGWTLKPGVLVRGNGGHVILEEIDKTSADLERMNDGLEGNQQITVDKAGINATLDTRVGLLVTGNPEDGRFDPHTSIPEQIDIDRSLLSRFDAIVTLEDMPDVDVDSEIAGTIGESYKEAAEAEFGNREAFESLDRHIAPEVGRAWIQYARENITPIPTEGAIARLREWYAEEARQLNDEDIVVPATPRKMEVGLRFASAYARVRLSETVTVRDVEHAIEVQKMLIGQTYDKEAGVFNADKHTEVASSDGPNTQKERRNLIYDTVQEHEPEDRGGVPMTEIQDRCERAGMERANVEYHVRQMVQNQKGGLYEPKSGEFKTE